MLWHLVIQYPKRNKQTKNPSLKSLPISAEKCFNVGKLLVVDTGFPEF